MLALFVAHPRHLGGPVRDRLQAELAAGRRAALPCAAAAGDALRGALSAAKDDPMILTVLEAIVPQGNEAALLSAYRAAASRSRPPGLVRSELQRDARDPTRWRIQTWWSSREALDAMRRTGTPEGVLMFRAAGAEPALSVFEIAEIIERLDEQR